MAALFRSLLKPQQISSFRLLTINSFSSSKPSSELELQAICQSANPDSARVITVFKHHGFSADEVLEVLMKAPYFLFSNPERNIQAKLTFLADSGISGKNLARLICANPYLLRRSLDKHIAPCILMFKCLFACCDGDSILNHLSIKQLNKALHDFSMAVAPTIERPENYQKLLRMGPRKIRDDPDKRMEIGIDKLSLNFIISIMEYK